jgi:RNA polymerase sigma-70 factor (ECF subfamily)
MPAESDPLTHLVNRWRNGSPDAGDKLSDLVQATLRKIAAAYLRREQANHTLQPTELVNEAYLRLIGLEGPISDRVHFFAIAARIMRRILVDHARRRRASKRAGFRGERISLSNVADDRDAELADVIALDSAMSKLAELDARQSQILELRYFAGLSIEDIATALDMSTATVKRDIMAGKLWLKRQLSLQTTSTGE